MHGMSADISCLDIRAHAAYVIPGCGSMYLESSLRAANAAAASTMDIDVLEETVEDQGRERRELRGLRRQHCGLHWRLWQQYIASDLWMKILK